MDKISGPPKVLAVNKTLYTSTFLIFSRNMPDTRSKAIEKDRRASLASGPHYNTPEKARFRQAIYEFKLNRLTLVTRYKGNIFKRFQILRRSVSRILSEERDRTASGQKERKETCRRLLKVALRQLQECERIITSFSF